MTAPSPAWKCDLHGTWALGDCALCDADMVAFEVHQPKHRADVPVDACRGLCGNPDCTTVDGDYMPEFTPRHRAEAAA